MKSRRDIALWVALFLLAQLGLSSGCATSRVQQLVQPARISQEQAIFIAEKEAVKRGWSRFEVFGKPTHLGDDRWQILLVRIPRVFGGHALVEVSADGNEIEWASGM